MNGSLVYWLLLSSLQTFGIEIQLISPVNGKKGNRVSVYRGRKLSSVSKIELFIKARYILLSRLDLSSEENMLKDLKCKSNSFQLSRKLGGSFVKPKSKTFIR